MATMTKPTQVPLVVTKNWQTVAKQYAAVWSILSVAIVVAVAGVFVFSIVAEQVIMGNPYLAGFAAPTATTGAVDIRIRTSQADMLVLVGVVGLAALFVQDWLEKLYYVLRRKFVTDQS